MLAKSPMGTGPIAEPSPPECPTKSSAGPVLWRGTLAPVPALHVDLPDLKQVSTVGLCHLMNALRCGGDALFHPPGSSSYPFVSEKDHGMRVVDTLLEEFTRLEECVEEELTSRPVPEDEDEREYRARMLTERYLSCHGIEGFHELAGRL